MSNPSRPTRVLEYDLIGGTWDSVIADLQVLLDLDVGWAPQGGPVLCYREQDSFVAPRQSTTAVVQAVVRYHPGTGM